MYDACVCKCIEYKILYINVFTTLQTKDNNHLPMCECRGCRCVYDDLTCLSATVRPEAKLRVFAVCVRAGPRPCMCSQTSRSAEVRLVMPLLCLVGTAAAVTFTNAMNQRQGGQAGRPKNNQLYSHQIDTGWTGQRGRARDGDT